MAKKDKEPIVNDASFWRRQDQADAAMRKAGFEPYSDGPARLGSNQTPFTPAEMRRWESLSNERQKNQRELRRNQDSFESRDKATGSRAASNRRLAASRAMKETTAQANERRFGAKLPRDSKDTGAYDRTIGRARGLKKRANGMMGLNASNAGAQAYYGREQTQKNAEPKAAALRNAIERLRGKASKK